MFPHLNIVIDSSIFHKHLSLNTKTITLLKVLGNRHLIDLYIPWVVFKECTTGAVAEIKDELSKAILKISAWEGKGVHTNEVMRLNEIIRDLEKFDEIVSESNAKLWNDFIYFSRATVLECNSHDMEAVFDSYFKGNEPFSQMKSRKDIPDAFIFNALKELASDEHISFVCQDANLRLSSANIPNVRTFSSLDELFSGKEMKEVMAAYAEQSPLDIKAEEKLFAKIVKKKKDFEKAVNRYFKRWVPGNISGFEVPDTYHDVYVDKISSFEVEIERRDLSVLEEAVFNRLKVTAKVTLVFTLWDEAAHLNKKRLGPLDINSWFQKYAEDRTVIFETTLYNDISDFDEKNLNITIESFEDITVL